LDAAEGYGNADTHYATHLFEVRAQALREETECGNSQAESASGLVA
jgi:Uri superfamily endonuclease